jgi:transketolase
MRGIPGMNVFCPADEEDMLMGLEKIFPYNSPFYIRYNNMKPIINHAPFEIGKAEILSSGDITILTYGMLLKEAFAAKEILQSDGKTVGVVNIRTIKPFDKETILKICSNSSLVVTLEDHFLTGGLFSVLSELLVLENLNCKVFPIGLNTWFKPAMLNDVLEFEGFTGKAIADKILKEIEPSTRFIKQYK